MADDGNMRMIKLGDIFTPEQITYVENLVAEIETGEKNAKELRQYLEGLQDQLLAKGIVPAYLYYMMCYQFKLL